MAAKFGKNFMITEHSEVRMGVLEQRVADNDWPAGTNGWLSLIPYASMGVYVITPHSQISIISSSSKPF
jgi:hypothetical protein